MNVWEQPLPSQPGIPQHRNPSSRSDGDLQHRRPLKEEEKMTPPLTLALWKDPEAATVSGSPSKDSWLGATRRGTADKQLSPVWSDPGRVSV